MGAEKERDDTQLALLYELRRLIDDGEQETFTKQELCKIRDDFAKTKAAE